MMNGLRLRSERCPLGCGDTRFERATISIEAHHHGRALRAGRQRRRERARAAGGDRRRARSAGRHREPARRRRLDRRRLCRARRAGWAYAAGRVEWAGHSRAAHDGEAGLPMAAGLRAGQLARLRHQHAAGAALAAGQVGQGAGGATRDKTPASSRSPPAASRASTTSSASCSSSRPASDGPRCITAAMRPPSTI